MNTTSDREKIKCLFPYHEKLQKILTVIGPEEMVPSDKEREILADWRHIYMAGVIFINIGQTIRVSPLSDRTLLLRFIFCHGKKG